MGGKNSGRKKTKKSGQDLEEAPATVVDGAVGKPRRTRKHLADPAAGNKEYFCEDILAECFDRGSHKWQVKWRGYDISHATWETLENLSGYEEFIARFNKERDDKNRESLEEQKSEK